MMKKTKWISKKRRNARFVGMVLFFSLMLVLVYSGPAQAQSSPYDVVVSWQSQTYVPPGYSGRSLPVGNSWIAAGVDVLRGGKTMDLSKQTIYWYRNNDLISSGTGNWKVGLQAPEVPGQVIDLRVEIPTLGQDVLNTIKIPVVRPVAAIRNSGVSNIIREGRNRISVIPYYFDVGNPGNLSYIWTVNGEDVLNNEDPQYIELEPRPGTPNGFLVNAQVVAINPGKLLESAKRMITLVFSK